MAANATRLSSSVTVAQYLHMEATGDRVAAGRFIKERLDERYLSPLLDVDRKQRHGFSMMAVACLAIEALQAFQLGLKSTKKNSENMFAAFFAQHPAFADFAGDGWFYDHIRCGLLHDAEARGGWRILRTGPLVNKEARTINATLFVRELRKAVSAYADELVDDQSWVSFKRKMKQVVANCEP